MYLNLKNINKKFKDGAGVFNMDISASKGELICFLGPSGCGKTTTLKIIGGFIKPDSGNISLDNVDITNLPPEKRPVATVFQSYALFPHLNVINNVIYGLKFKHIKKEQALQLGKEMLQLVGLQGSEHKKINEISGGQMQRVALARSLVLKPKILLLDEPLSNLDAKLRIKMREEIKEIQKKFDVTMVFVTHDQEEALSIADKIYIMNKGIIEQVGTPEEVYRMPANPFVADFIGRINTLNINGKKKMVRPENIQISFTEGEIKGKIKLKQFKGNIVTYTVKTEDCLVEVDYMGNNEGFNLEDDVMLKINYF